jgi:aminopeptidase-like protein
MDEHMLKHQPEPFSAIPFALTRTDERPYCSPGFDVPVGNLMRTPYQTHMPYNTLLDNKSLMDFSALERTVALYLKVFKGWERNAYCVKNVQFCEPHLRKRGLYNTLGGLKNRAPELSSRLHLLTYADGHHDLLEIAKRFRCNLREFEDNLKLLIEDGLLEELKK